MSPGPQFEVGHVSARERSRNLWRSKQNRCTCISCGHCNIYMIICRNGIYIVGCCTQSENRRRKSKFIYMNLGTGLNGGQCQNKIGGAHLCHVGIAMYV